MLFMVFACEKETEFSKTSQNENHSQNLAGRFPENTNLADYPITDPFQLINASNYSFEIQNLNEFEDIYMDFVGVSRQNLHLGRKQDGI